MANYITKVRTVSGDIQIDYNALANLPKPDATLTQDGSFADAKATGEAIDKLSGDLVKGLEEITPEKIGALPITYVPPVTSVFGLTGDVALQEGAGISVNGAVIVNSGVRAVIEGTENGTLNVDTNGECVDVPVKGLKSAAYTESSEYAPAVHTHTSLYFATIPADGWNDVVPYEQTIEVAGILESDYPDVELDMRDIITDDAAIYQDEWSYVGRIEALNDNITAYCYDYKPEMDLKILIKVVR